MKTSRTRAAGQQTGRKARTRSTSALATETRAKALPRRLAALACNDPEIVEAHAVEQQIAARAVTTFARSA